MKINGKASKYRDLAKAILLSNAQQRIGSHGARFAERLARIDAYTKPKPKPKPKRAVDDKDHPRFIAGYMAGLADAKPAAERPVVNTPAAERAAFTAGQVIVCVSGTSASQLEVGNRYIVASTPDVGGLWVQIYTGVGVTKTFAPYRRFRALTEEELA